MPEPSPPSSPSRRWQLAIGLAFLIAIALRWWMLASNIYPSYDGTFYLNTARQLAAFGQLEYSPFPPGYPMLVLPVLLATGWEDPAVLLRAGQLVNLLAGSLHVLLGALLVRRVAGGVWGLLAAIVLAGLPLLLSLSVSDLSELSYACALIGGWMLWDRGRRFPAGVVWAYGYLIRPEAPIVAMALAALTLRRDGAREALKVILPTSVTIFAYSAFVYTATGKLVPSGKWGFIETSIQEHAGVGLLSLAGRNTAELLGMLIGILGVPLAVMFVLGLFRRGGSWKLLLLPLLVLPFFSFRMDARYLAPYLPVFLLAALQGGQLLYRWLGRWSSGPIWRDVLAAAVLVLALGGAVSANFSSWPPPVTGEPYPGLRTAGEWLSGRCDRETLVVARKPYVSYWAWCRFRRIPDSNNLEGLVDWAEEHGGRILVVNMGVAAGMAPVLLPLSAYVPEPLESRVALLERFEFADAPIHTTYLFGLMAARPRPSPTGATSEGASPSSSGEVSPP